MCRNIKKIGFTCEIQYHKTAEELRELKTDLCLYMDGCRASLPERTHLHCTYFHRPTYKYEQYDSLDLN